jgi:hypothetical protein
MHIEVVPYNVTASWQLWFNTGDYYGQNKHFIFKKSVFHEFLKKCAISINAALLMV